MPKVAFAELRSADSSVIASLFPRHPRVQKVQYRSFPIGARQEHDQLSTVMALEARTRYFNVLGCLRGDLFQQLRTIANKS